jgi:hypothetical protein
LKITFDGDIISIDGCDEMQKKLTCIEHSGQHYRTMMNRYKMLLKKGMEDRAKLGKLTKLMQTDLLNQRRSLTTLKDDGRLVQESPIRAIFKSFGESGPIDPQPSALVFMKRRHNMKKWIGIQDFEVFMEEIDWEPNKKTMGPDPIFNRREQLLIFLITLRQGFTFSHLNMLCGLSRTRVTEIFTNVLNELYAWSKKVLKLPTLVQLSQMRSIEFVEEYGNVYMLFVDGTVLRSFHPSNDELNRMSWSFKHHQACKSVTVLIAENGYIVWVSETVPGKIADREAWNECEIAQTLRKTYAGTVDFDMHGRRVPFTMAIGADKGYPGIWIPQGWILHLTKSAKRADWSKSSMPSQLKAQDGLYLPKRPQVVMDERLAKYRAKVECVIGKLKEFELLNSQYFVHFHTHVLDKAINVAAAICDWKIVIHE